MELVFLNNPLLIFSLYRRPYKFINDFNFLNFIDKLIFMSKVFYKIIINHTLNIKEQIIYMSNSVDRAFKIRVLMKTDYYIIRKCLVCQKKKKDSMKCL